jgi:elongation factor P
MVIASELREGMIVRIEGQTYKVLEVEAKAGAAEMGGVVKTKLISVRGGRMWEPHFRPQERLEELELEHHVLEFPFAQNDTYTFMRPDTYEQVEVPSAILGPGERFFQPGIELPVEFFENEPIGVVFPEVAEVRVAETAPAGHSHGACKEATLENGLAIRVPLFIAPGETVRVEVKIGRYLERMRIERKRSA